MSSSRGLNTETIDYWQNTNVAHLCTVLKVSKTRLAMGLQGEQQAPGRNFQLELHPTRKLSGADDYVDSETGAAVCRTFDVSFEQ